MPYPSKTDRQTILSAAVKDLARGGIRDLSLRSLAASLDLAPTAIYRYFSDRSALEAALANEAARQLERALRKAADGCEPATTIRKMSSAYIKFARDNRHLYEVMMSLHAPEHDATSRQSLWTFTVEQVQRVAGASRAAEASVALWAFLHRAVALEAAQVSAIANRQAALNSDSTRGSWLSLHMGANGGTPSHAHQENGQYESVRAQQCGAKRHVTIRVATHLLSVRDGFASLADIFRLREANSAITA